QDTSIPVADLEQAQAKAQAAHKIVKLYIYPDAPHGFHADYRPSYRQADAEDGWRRMLAWLRHYGLAPKTTA
ncbi:MAG TPA: dienelactone hydrolase family protein, partial [Acetobacteraceae bacterium]|nr:dienelactone hydrolase family protein [Acetobacteraceae bacterium]